MSRRLTSIQQRPRISTHVTADNPYQVGQLKIKVKRLFIFVFLLQSTTTEPSHQENFYIHRPKHFTRDSCQTKCSHHYQNDCTKVSGVSDDNFTDTNTYYEYFPDNVYHPSPRKDSRNVEYTFSDDSGSTSLPRYDYEEVSLKRHSRNTASDRGFKAMQQVSVKNGKVLNNVLVHKDVRKIYPNQENQCDRLYHEIVGPRSVNVLLTVRLDQVSTRKYLISIFVCPVEVPASLLQLFQDVIHQDPDCLTDHKVLKVQEYLVQLLMVVEEDVRLLKMFATIFYR